MIRYLLLFASLALGYVSNGQLNGTIEYLVIKNQIPTVNFNLPEVREWNLVMDTPPESGVKGVLMFKHKPIDVKCSDCKVEPIIAVLYESIADSIDAIEYSVNYLGTKPYQLDYTLLGGYPEHSGDKQSVVFDAKYVRDEVEHTVILTYITNKSFGIEIICDSTTEAFPIVEEQMRTFVKNFSIN